MATIEQSRLSSPQLDPVEPELEPFLDVLAQLLADQVLLEIEKQQEAHSKND